MHKRKKDGAWQIFWRDQEGRQHNKTFGKSREAKRQAEAFDKQIKAGKPVQAADVEDLVQESGLCWDELATRWYSFMGGTDDRKKTKPWLWDWKEVLWNHILPAFEMKPVEEFAELEIVEAVARARPGCKDITRQRYTSYLKIITAWGVKHKLVKLNPLAEWQKEKEQRRQTRLTVQDAQRIMAVAPLHLRWAMEVAFSLGVRVGPSELLALLWSDIDWGTGVIRVFAPKTKTERLIPLTPAFMARLREMQANAKCGHLVEYRGEQLKSIRKSFKAACEKAGLDYTAVPYDLRHLFATTLLNNGADLAAVSKLMGHASTKMTADVYYQYMAGEKRRAVELLPLLKLPEAGAQAGEQEAL